MFKKATITLIVFIGLTTLNAQEIKDSTLGMEYTPANYSFNGKVINDRLSGPWNFNFEDGVKGVLMYKKGSLNGTSFSLSRAGDTIGKKYYNKSKLKWEVIFNKQHDTVYHMYIDQNKIKHTYIYFDDNRLHQYIATQGQIFKTIITNDSTGKQINKGIGTNGVGTFVKYYIANDTFLLVESCPLENGLLNGNYIRHKNNDTTIFILGKVKYKGGEVEALEDRLFALKLQPMNEYDREGVFSNGEDGFQGAVIGEFNMPRIASELEISGTIYIQFMVEMDGTIITARAIAPEDRQLGYGLEKECIRVIKNSSRKWVPARKFGFPVRSYWRFPFEIDNSSF